jgi:hypothetical protein
MRARVPTIAAVWLVASGPAWAQRLGQAPDADFAWLRWLLALGLCLGLAAAGALALRARMGVGRPAVSNPLSLWLKATAPGSRRLRVLETVRATPTLEVCLLACDGREYLVAATPHSVVQLSPSSDGAAP